MALTCPLCQTDNPDRATSCSVCGNTLSLPTPQPSVSPPPILPHTKLPSQIVPPAPLPPSTASPETVAFALPLPWKLQSGRYELQRVLGEGGFAITYYAIDTRTQKVVVVKERWPIGGARQQQTGEVRWKRGTKLPEEVQKFRIESELLQKCNHPSIVSCHDFFEENNTCYIVMDFLDGQSLYHRVQQNGPLSESEARKYLLQLAEALKIIHDQKILHRDIKPENIMFDSTGNRAVLIDFGIAREYQENMTKDMTSFVSVYYSPLEQLSKVTKRTASADVFSLCASFYYALVGQDPLPATDRSKSLLNNGSDNLMSPQDLGANISPEFQEIILMGMSIEIKKRFVNADHLAESLRSNLIPRGLYILRQKLGDHSKPLSSTDLMAISQEYKSEVSRQSSNSTILPELLKELSQILLVLKQDEEALNYAQQAYSLDGSDPKIQGILGVILYRQSRWPEAIPLLQSAYQLYSNVGWLAVYLAFALSQGGRYSEAQAVVQPWIERIPQQAFAPELQGHLQGLQAWLAFHQGQWKQAIRFARLTLKLLKDTGELQLQPLQTWLYPCLVLATAEAVKGKGSLDVDRCLEEFDQAVPGNQFSPAYRGWQQLSVGSQQAVSSLQRLSYSPDTPPWSLVNMGIAAEQAHNWIQAIEAYQHYETRCGQNPRILGRLAWALGQQGQWEDAFRVIEQGLTTSALASLTALEEAQLWHNKGWILLSLIKQAGSSQLGSIWNDRYEAMKEAYNKALGLYQRDPTQQTQAQAVQNLIDLLP